MCKTYLPALDARPPWASIGLWQDSWMWMASTMEDNNHNVTQLHYTTTHHRAHAHTCMSQVHFGTYKNGTTPLLLSFCPCSSLEVLNTK